MSGSVSSFQTPSRRQRVRIGLLKLTDAAPVIVAHEYGYFRDAGIDAEISVEPSWANIADKLAYGFLDGAVILPPLALGLALGLRGAACPVIVPMSLSLGGNTVTLAKPLAERIEQENADASNSLNAARILKRLIASGECGKPTLGVVHSLSTHNLLLRHWLAAGGVDVERHVSFRVIPPSRMTQSLEAGEIAGFCAGAPWGTVAERSGIGKTVTTSHGIWHNAPEKAFAVTQACAEENPGALVKLIAALLRAAQFCDDAINADRISQLLAEPRYLGLDASLICTSLPVGGTEQANLPSRRSIFFRNAATFPWRSHALWFLAQMKRWRLIDESVDSSSIAASVYRPDLYRSAAGELGISSPLDDLKIEGAHHESWQAAGTFGPIDMGSDRFCDGAVFAP